MGPGLWVMGQQFWLGRVDPAKIADPWRLNRL